MGLPRHRLSERYTTEQLVEMMQRIESLPENREPPGGLHIYTPKARKKLEEISHAIAAQVAARRAAAGNPVPCSGYSGRQTNRRR